MGKKHLKQKNLDRMLNPKQIVFIGGRQLEGSIRACIDAGYKGDIYAVNPTRSELAGIACVTSIADLPETPDAAMLGLSPQRSLEAVQQLAKIGAGGAVCMSAGFAEQGEEGKKLQQGLIDAAGDMAVIGPNCMGILNQFDGACIWGEDNHIERTQGNGCAIISQSGAFLFGITNVEQALPLGYAISTGNQAVVDMADCIEAVLRDDRVKAIGLYLEGMDDGKTLGHACWKALKKGVPVIALKGGDSPAGEAVALSHTASMVVERDIWDAFCDRYGLVEVSTPKALLEALKLLSIGGIPAGNCVSILSFSGGLNGLVAKWAAELELDLPEPTTDNKVFLRDLMPETVTISNPLDLNIPFKSRTGLSMENAKALEEAMVALAEDISDQLVLFVDVPRPNHKQLDVAWHPVIGAVAEAAKSLNKPCSVAGILPEGLPLSLRHELLGKAVPPLLGFSETMEALKISAKISTNRKRFTSREEPPELLCELDKPREYKGHRMLDEAESKTLLTQFGLTTPHFMALPVARVGDAAEQLGYPLAIKVLSNHIAHKARVGGVRLNIKTAEELDIAVSEMTHAVAHAPEGHVITHILVEKMVENVVGEFIIGIKHHDALGLVLMVGHGGSHVEERKSYKSLLLPLQEDSLRDVLEHLGLKKGTIAFISLTKAVEAVARFAEHYQRKLITLDVNPVMLTNAGDAFASDALIALSEDQEK